MRILLKNTKGIARVRLFAFISIVILVMLAKVEKFYLSPLFVKSSKVLELCGNGCLFFLSPLFVEGNICGSGCYLLPFKQKRLLN